MSERPKRLLTQNSELRADGVYNWTLPAWVVEMPDGSKVNTCPSAGACIKVCYARQGSYLFPMTQAAHKRNLAFVIEDLSGFIAAMVLELQEDRFRGGRFVRIHDSGDFFTEEYLRAWLTIAELVRDVTFYAYTKEVSLFKRVVEPSHPENFRWLYSMGGKEDHLIDVDKDRHADVFTTEQAMIEAGYLSQDESDLLAITLPTTRIGIPANNIPAFRKKMRGRSFSEMERDREEGNDPIQAHLPLDRVGGGPTE